MRGAGPLLLIAALAAGGGALGEPAPEPTTGQAAMRAAAPHISPAPSPRAAAAHVSPTPSARDAAPKTSPAPAPRGAALKVTARAAPVGAGSVCGDPRLIGVRIPAISGAHPGCGVEAPVRLVAVAGVSLTGKAEVTCENAVALADWVEQTAQPAAIGLLSTRLVSIRSVASYVCRPRNGKKGAKLSEHAKGNALDIAGFSFAGGETVAVTRGWSRTDPRGKYLRKVWAGACGPFGTVLGPEANHHHHDHFHFDTARYQNGTYCR